MNYEINGTTMQTVAIDLAAGEKIYSQTATMAWMSDNITMDTHTGGGLWAGLKRSISGGSLFVTTFTAQSSGQITFAAKFPGTLMPVTLKDGESLLCRKETFLCAEESVHLDIEWQKKLGAGFFAGEGFVLQKVTGPGTVWLDLAGEIVIKDLQAGERLLVHAGHIGVQSPDVTTDIQMVSGFKNFLFGGNGIYLATLTGPGRVWLQSMPLIHLAEEIARYLPQPTNAETGAIIGGGGTNSVAGAAVGGLLGLAATVLTSRDSD